MVSARKRVRDAGSRAAGPKRCLLCVVPLLVMTGVELNAFFLKRVLWIPPRNALNTCRLCIWVGACRGRCSRVRDLHTCRGDCCAVSGMALPAMKEFYVFVADDEPHAKLGAFAWLSLACFALETLVRAFALSRAGRVTPVAWHMPGALMPARASAAGCAQGRRWLGLVWGASAGRGACVLVCGVGHSGRRLAGMGGAGKPAWPGSAPRRNQTRRMRHGPTSTQPPAAGASSMRD
jgi:hypothetical protein